MTLLLGIFAVVIALPLLWVLLTYNGLVRGRVRAQASFSQIDVQLKRRCDLIPNLVETVKGAMAHERQTLEAVTRARQAALAGLGALQMKPDDYVALRAVAQASQSIDRLLAGLRVTIENYPQLKTSTNVLALQEELSSTENRIAFARQAYNDSVMSYNTSLAVFPSNLIAGLFRFTAMGLFEAAGDDRALPEVRLSAKD
jgi:LemA protein